MTSNEMHASDRDLLKAKKIAGLVRSANVSESATATAKFKEFCGTHHIPIDLQEALLKSPFQNTKWDHCYSLPLQYVYGYNLISSFQFMALYQVAQTIDDCIIYPISNERVKVIAPTYDAEKEKVEQLKEVLEFFNKSLFSYTIKKESRKLPFSDMNLYCFGLMFGLIQVLEAIFYKQIPGYHREDATYSQSNDESEDLLRSLDCHPELLKISKNYQRGFKDADKFSFHQKYLSLPKKGGTK